MVKHSSLLQSVSPAVVHTFTFHVQVVLLLN